MPAAPLLAPRRGPPPRAAAALLHHSKPSPDLTSPRPPPPTQIAHSCTEERLECLRSITDHVEKNVYPILRSTESLWQPTDFLPDSSSPDFLDEVRELQARTACLPDDYLVVLVGDMITEEALPTYMAMLNTLDGVRDETGAADTPWAKWTREWTAEENRHGDLMNKYCYLSGRVNMKAIEWTIQNLIGSGMDPRTENNPYFGFIYTSFQERATKVSHGNTALHAAEHGDKVLGKICAAIAGDEARHERAYQKIVDELFERDPSGSMLALEAMFRRSITMPAHLMNDGTHASINGKAKNTLFNDFASVAQATGTYTGKDYCEIMEFLIKHFKVADRTGLSADAARAQDEIFGLHTKMQKLVAIQDRRMQSRKPVGTKFSWLFNREIPVIPM